MANKDLKLLITGAGGRIGTVLLPALQERFTVRNFNLNPIPGDPACFLGDLQDLEALKRAMDDQDVVFHLAATSTERPFVEQLLPNNILGMYNLLEAACACGVPRIVFASTVHTMTPPKDNGEPQEQRWTQTRDPFNPDSRYGATKAFGEVLGRYYYEQHGLEFVAVRIGWFCAAEERATDNDYLKHIWLSPRDALEIFSRAIELPDLGFLTVMATSKCPRPWMSLKETQEVLGYEPQDVY